MPTKYFSKTIECVFISLIIRFQGIFCGEFSTSTEPVYVSLVYWEFDAVVKSKNKHFYKLKKYSEISTFLSFQQLTSQLISSWEVVRLNIIIDK